MPPRAVVLVLLAACGVARVTSDGTPELVQFIGDYIRFKGARGAVLFQSAGSGHLTPESIFAIISNLNAQYMYFAACYNISMETSLEDTKRLLEGSSHGSDAINIIVSDDDNGMDFMDKVNASGWFGQLDSQHQWLVFSHRGRVVDRWRTLYLPVNNQVTIAEIWQSADSDSDSDSDSVSDSGLPPGLDRGPVTRVQLVELYHLAPGLPARTDSVGRWSPESGPQNWTDRSIYERRNDFSGLTLRVAVKEGAPMTKFVSAPVPDVDGYMGVIWKLLANILKFNYTLRPSVDGEWGGVDAHGRWTGLVGMLQRREVDASVGHLSITQDRSKVIDYTESLFTIGYSMFIKKPSTLDLSWTTYLDSFDGPLWTLVGVTVVCGSLAMASMYLIERRWLTEPGRPPAGDGVLDTLLHFFGIACQQGAEHTPSGLSTRFFFWVFFFSMVIVHAAYSATLVSFLAAQKVVLPFENLEGLLADGTYGLGVVNGTSMYDYFKYSKSPINREVFKRHVVGLRDHTEGWGRIMEDKMAYFAWSGSLEATCDIVKLGNEYYKHSVAFGLQKHSPYKPFFDYHLFRLIEGGMMKHTADRELTKTESCEDRQIQGLGLPSVVSAFVMLAGGHVLGLLVMAAELVWRRASATGRHGPDHRLVGVLRLGDPKGAVKLLTSRASRGYQTQSENINARKYEEFC